MTNTTSGSTQSVDTRRLLPWFILLIFLAVLYVTVFNV